MANKAFLLLFFFFSSFFPPRLKMCSSRLSSVPLPSCKIQSVPKMEIGPDLDLEFDEASDVGSSLVYRLHRSHLLRMRFQTKIPCLQNIGSSFTLGIGKSQFGS